MVRSAVISAARKVSSFLAPAPAPAPARRILYDLTKKSECYRDPSLWTVPAAAGDALMSKRSSLQASSRKPIFFLSRFLSDCIVLIPISAGDDGSLSSKYSIRFPYPGCRISEFDMFYSCNGLFCYPAEFPDDGIYVEDDNVFVWNPTTLEAIKLPKSPHNKAKDKDKAKAKAKGDIYSRLRKSNAFVATWSDPESEDYKVLRFYHYCDRSTARAYPPAEVELYSLKTNSWKKLISEELAMFVDLPPHSYCYINGVLYTAVSLNNSVHLSILPFDFRTETFSTALPFPNLGYQRSYKLVKYDGQLSLLSQHHPDYNKFVHWVMRNGEWVRLAEYDTKYCSSEIKPIGFARNGLLLFEGVTHGGPQPHQNLMVFDSATGEFKQLHGFATKWSLRLFEFGETFIKLKSSSGDLEEEEEEAQVSYFGDFTYISYGEDIDCPDDYSYADDDYCPADYDDFDYEDDDIDVTEMPS